MSDTAAACQVPEMIFGLNDRPPFWQAAVAAVQHLLSVVISIGAPPLLICRALDMPMDITVYMVNIAFFVSGIGTLLQTTPVGPVGSGLLCIQATSFIFPTAFIALGVSAMAADPSISKEKLVALMTGATIAGSLVKIVLSRMTGLLNKVFTPLVCGITVSMVGISLLNTGMLSFVGGRDAVGTADYASLKNLGVGAAVLLTIFLCNCSRRPALRMSAMVVGFVVGSILAWTLGMLKPLPENIKYFSLPVPFKYGLDFSWGGFISIALLYVVSTVEATGDIAATSMLSKEPTQGPAFTKRLSGGIMGDGVASMIAGVFNSFPMAIFAQNNGVIQLIGNASRHVGKFIAVYLIILGVFPVVGVIFNVIPDAVLGGALILLFGIILSTGLRIIFTECLDRRAIMIIAISFGLGIGTAFQPEFARNLPPAVADLLHSPVAVAGLTAIITNLLLPAGNREEVGAPH